MANALLAVLLHSETLILRPLVIDLHLLVIDLQAVRRSLPVWQKCVTYSYHMLL